MLSMRTSTIFQARRASQTVNIIIIFANTTKNLILPSHLVSLYHYEASQCTVYNYPFFSFTFIVK